MCKNNGTIKNGSLFWDTGAQGKKKTKFKEKH